VPNEDESSMGYEEGAEDFDRRVAELKDSDSGMRVLAVNGVGK